MISQVAPAVHCSETQVNAYAGIIQLVEILKRKCSQNRIQDRPHKMIQSFLIVKKASVIDVIQAKGRHLQH